jgi:hypothetical protein
VAFFLVVTVVTPCESSTLTLAGYRDSHYLERE